MNRNKKKIRKDEVLSLLVETFFRAFAAGIMYPERPEQLPANLIKERMLEHYEHIAPVFNEEVFYAIVRMNYEEGEMEPLLQADRANGQVTANAMDLMRKACRTETFFQTMADEYRRNFMLLLEGRVPADERQRQPHVPNKDLGDMDESLAVSIMNSLCEKAFRQGQRYRK